MAKFALRRAAIKAVSGLIAPFRLFSLSPFRGRIERILIAPQDLRTSDPTAAGDIYSGYFAFAGKILATEGQSPFTAIPPSRAWAETLNGFGWLRDIRAADTALSRANARTLVDDWIKTHGRPNASEAWTRAVIARRLMSWISHSPVILDGADRAFYRRFMMSIRRQAAYLWKKSRSIGQEAGRLESAIALTAVALCTNLGLGRKRRVVKHLIKQLQKEILSDGGHISRNPQALIDLLADLLPLKHCFPSNEFPPPPELLNAIDRMMPMLRLFRHDDGTVALFNGMSTTPPDTIATLLAYQDARAGTAETAGPSGYRRIHGEDTILMMDVGRPPPEAFSLTAHAGCLSFELSDRGEKIISNCGAPPEGRDTYRALARATAAHSTLVIDDTSSCHFAPIDEDRWPAGGPVLEGPHKVTALRESDEASEKITATHDAYARKFGVIHRRTLTLGRDGGWLIGEDGLEPASKRKSIKKNPIALRFHLHPAIRVDVQEPEIVKLHLPSGTIWTFSCEKPVAVEESILFASQDGSRRTAQLVIAETTDIGRIKWSLVREGGSPTAR
jgi:uncharacterized heparinase superfamily protein